MLETLLEIVALLISFVVDGVRTVLFSRPPASQEVQQRLHKRNKRKRARLVSRGRKSSQKR